MDIAAADAAGTYANEHFVRLQRGNRIILNGKLAIFFEDEGFHAGKLQEFTGLGQTYCVKRPEVSAPLTIRET